MAIIRSQIFGDLSGRLGGVVFSRNTTDKIVRAYVMPTDAKTVQQMNNRGGFSSVNALWASLSMNTKQSWNSFANSLFVPKKGRKANRYSGQNAFVSINSVLNTCYRSNYQSILAGPAGHALYHEFESSILIPPQTQVYPGILSQAGSLISLTLNDFQFNSSTKSCTLILDMSPGSQELQPVFTDNTGLIYQGFAVYLSNPLTQGQTNTSGMEEFLIGSVRSPYAISDWTTRSNLTFSWTVPDIYFRNIKTQFLSNSYIFATCYLINFKGQSLQLGRKLIQIF